MDTKKVLSEIVEELVDKPEGVSIEEVKANATVVINIKVAQGDLGKVIGKKGRIITALRSVFGSIYAKGGTKLIIEVTDR
jgi:hypothetical protein